MAEMLIQSESLTSIADKIRVLKGITEPMSLDDMETELGTVDNAVTAALSALVEKGVEVPEGTNVTGLAELIAAIEAGGGDEKKVKGDITPAAATQTLTITHGLGKIPKYFCIINTNYFGSTASAFERVQPSGTAKQSVLGIVFAGGRTIAAYPWYSAGYYACMDASGDTSGFYAISDINEQTISFDITYYSICQFEATKHCWEAM